MESSLLTAKDVATILNVSVKVVRSLVKRGLIQAAHIYADTKTGDLRFKAAWVKEYLKKLGC